MNALVRDVLDPYAEHSIFTKAGWDKYDDAEGEPALTPDTAAQMILGQKNKLYTIKPDQRLDYFFISVIM